MSYRSGVEILLRNLTIIKRANEEGIKGRKQFYVCWHYQYFICSYNTAAEKRYKKTHPYWCNRKFLFSFLFFPLYTHILLVKYFRKFTGNNISHIKWHQKSNLELLDARLLSFFSSYNLIEWMVRVALCEFVFGD